MTDALRDTATTYFTSWKTKDFDTLRSVISDHATFRGPLGAANSGDECLAGLKGMSQMVTDIRILKQFVDGNDVLTWFDLYTDKAGPTPTANWMHIEDGKIARIRVLFDPREILGL